MYQEGTKLNKLYKKINKNDELKDIIKKPNHLMKIVMKTRKYPYLNEYINKYLKIYPEKVDNKNSDGETSLMLAAENSQYCSSNETVKILLKHGANNNLQDNDGYTALMSAAQFSGAASSIETVKLLLDNNADVNLQDNNGLTALMYAIRNFGVYSASGTVKMLLDHNTDVNLQDSDGSTALMYAIYYSQESIKLLLNYGADGNLQDDYNYTALTYAMSYCETCNVKKVVKTLLKYNIDIDIKTRSDNNATTLAFLKCKNVIDIILPSRKIFIDKVTVNKNKILMNKSEFWKVKSCDYKVIYALTMSFEYIIKFL